MRPTVFFARADGIHLRLKTDIVVTVARIVVVPIDGARVILIVGPRAARAGASQRTPQLNTVATAYSPGPECQKTEK